MSTSLSRRILRPLFSQPTSTAAGLNSGPGSGDQRARPEDPRLSYAIATRDISTRQLTT